MNALIAAGSIELAELDPQSELEAWARHTRRLGTGESASLAAAAHRGWSIALDDRAARRVAEQVLGQGAITGTVGILRSAVETAFLTAEEGDGILQAMIDAGYWSPTTTLIARS